MSLKSRIQSDMKLAMQAKDKIRLSSIRLILAAIKKIEIDDPQIREQVSSGSEDETYVLTVLNKLAKQSQDAIDQFTAAHRQDLVDKETADLKVIQDYLPPPLSEDTINQLIETAIKETEAKTMQDMRKVMAALNPHIEGRADRGQISIKIKQKLS